MPEHRSIADDAGERRTRVEPSAPLCPSCGAATRPVSDPVLVGGTAIA